MELREWAERVFRADCLEEKLLEPPGELRTLSDEQPGEAVPWSRPVRPAQLQIAPRQQRKKFPHPTSMADPEMRVRALHAFANHELMALEMMAWALLAFPQAEKSFRRGLAHILQDEQRHFRLYCERLTKMGVNFGDLPVNDHFWRSGPNIREPLEWVCAMHLTFEQSNLDHAPFYGKLFLEADDPASADLMKVIFEDEISHVRFGSTWLKRYKSPDESAFEAFVRHCGEINPPERARGILFQEQARREAGLDDDFIGSLLAWEPK